MRRSVNEVLADHPVLLGIAGVGAYFWGWTVLTGWLIREYGHNCHASGYYARTGWYRASESCDFDIAPGLNLVLSLLVSDPFYGVLGALFVGGLPLMYVWAMLRNRSDAVPPAPARPSPYGDDEAHANLLRSKGVAEDQIEAIRRRKEDS